MATCLGPGWECADAEATTHVEIRDDERPSNAVLRAVADATGRDLFSLEPLYEAVDPDAVDALFRHRNAEPSTEAALCFVYEGCVVGVTSDAIRVCPK